METARLSKQCTCGRSAAYPYCDNTHKQKDLIIKNLDSSSFVYFKPNLNFDSSEYYKGTIACVPRLISKGLSERIISKLQYDSLWENVGFHKAKTMPHEAISNVDKEDMSWDLLVETMKKSVEAIFNKKVINNCIYFQKWPEGSYGVKHNDTHNFDGSVGNITYNIATTLFLHSSFTGGKLEFPDHNISIDPEPGFLYVFTGGRENEHQVTEIESGLRLTVTGFWDFEDAEYSEDEMILMKENQKKWAVHVNGDRI